MEIDPAVLATVLNIAGGAVGAALIGLTGAWVGSALQRRAEHARWVRERRYEANLRVLQLLDRMQQSIHNGIRIPLPGTKSGAPLFEEVTDEIARISVLGPERLRDRASELRFALLSIATRQPDAGRLYDVARAAYIDEIRKHVKINPGLAGAGTNPR
jgi:hypothetical protein